MKHIARQRPLLALFVACLLGATGRKLSAQSDFLQVEEQRSGASQEHRTRMESYKSLRQNIQDLASEADPGEGAGMKMYVDTVKNLLNNSMIQAIRSQFAADETILKNAVSSFGLCNDTLEGALSHPNAVRAGGHGSLYKGLSTLKVKHNDCRGRQEAKKIEYDMCMDTKENHGQLMNASCDGNFSKFYNKAGSGTTGQWEETCDTKQTIYKQNPPADIALIHHPGIGAVDVEGYLIEQFDYFSTLVADYEYAEKLCFNRTRDFEDTRDRCEKLFKEHGDLTAECDNFQDTLDAEACTQAEQRHRACLAYDRCYAKADKDMVGLKRSYCAGGGQEEMLKTEAKAIAQVDCMLEALKLYTFDDRKQKLEECIKDGGAWDTSFMDSLDFKECDFVNPTKTSSDLELCASHTNPMNDDDMSGTPGYIAKYYTGPASAANGYPLPGSADDATDLDNAPKTDVKACMSTCCTHPPTDGWEKTDAGNATVSAAQAGGTTTTTTLAVLDLPSGSIPLKHLPEHLRKQVDTSNLPTCGYCGSDFVNGQSQLVKCQRCWGKCCDPPLVTACADKNKPDFPTCEDSTALLALQSQVQLLSEGSHQRGGSHRKALGSVKRRRSDHRDSESLRWQQLVLRARRQAAARLRRQ